MLVLENVLLRNLVAFAPTYLFESGFLNAFSIKQIIFFHATWYGGQYKNRKKNATENSIIQQPHYFVYVRYILLYRWPMNKTELNCTFLLICWFFSINILKKFLEICDNLKKQFSPCLFYCKSTVVTHMTCVNCMLLTLPVSSRLSS